ncbi:MAG TPA: type II toxin-antitoxin system YafQ family toxin, partial [Candidatus Kapabacteria bacterium]|nr:type II toxin-antitoxin system YafQ family toxin [Candidatus Kapabacteria bacterium]
RRQVKRGNRIEKLDSVMLMLAEERQLPTRLRDHKLVGNFEGSRECHIEPDWLLIYSILDGQLYFERTGTHSDLFGK